MKNECFEPRMKKRRCDGWWKWWRWRWTDMIMKQWRIRKREMRTWLTKWARKLIPEVRRCVSKWVIC